ncbi:MAG TPA: serine/threonine-protein kinase [Bryobacteraceae bacterium]|nr:serine/threonine-protein kinase [Bryobacteraceae bacterium]
MTQNSRLGTFILDSLLGRGGMGEVWRGHVELVPQKQVAIKIILPRYASDPDFRARFQREAVAMASLSNVPVVPLENFFEENGHLVLVMPYIEGETLDRVIERNPSGMPLEEIQHVSTGVLSALEAAHQRGIIHRDIKPQNILIGRNGSAYLMDFGIAKVVDPDGSGHTSAGMCIGTAEYMSPEQINATEAPDGRSDIYGFGCVLYQMATGELPFRTATTGHIGQLELLRLHLMAPPNAPSQRNPAVHPGLEAVILRAMEKHPQNRFSTCLEFRTSLIGLQPADSGYPRTIVQGAIPKSGPATMPPQAIPAQRPVPAPLPPPPGGLPFAKFVGLAAMLLALAGGAWWVVHDREDAPAEPTSKKEEPEKKEKKEEGKPRPVVVPAGAGLPAQQPQQAPPQPPRPTLNPVAEEHYKKARHLEENGASISDFCSGQALAEKAVAADRDSPRPNPKYQELAARLAKSCGG